MVTKAWLALGAQLFGELTRQELAWLLSPHHHVSLLAMRRARLVGERVRLIASLFAVLTPLWVLVDIMTLPREAWLGIALARLLATAGFMALVLWFPPIDRWSRAYGALAVLLGLALAFYAFSVIYLGGFALGGVSAFFVVGYGFMPYVLLGILSALPLTLLESALSALALLAFHILAATLRTTAPDWSAFAVELWLLGLIGAIAVLACMSQLGFLVALIREAVRDPLTASFSRRSGEELLELQLVLATRTDAPLAVAFIDLDHFQRVNTQHGHEAGDRTLADVAATIRGTLRSGDMLVRWGGDQFLLILPYTDVARAQTALDRLRLAGIGRDPGAEPLTASIGLAERARDRVRDGGHLVQLAERRMRAAKSAGRDCVIVSLP